MALFFASCKHENMDPLGRKVRCKRISRAGELLKQPPEGHEPNNTACACVFTRVGTGQLAPTHAGAGNAICGAKREKSKGASGAFSRTLTARQRPSHQRCACTNQYTHTLTNSLTHSGREGWKRRNNKLPCSCHCPWLEAARGRRRRRSLTCWAWAGGRAGGCTAKGAAADSARHPLLISGDIHQRRQLPPASPTQWWVSECEPQSARLLDAARAQNRFFLRRSPALCLRMNVCECGKWEKYARLIEMKINSKRGWGLVNFSFFSFFPF